MNRVKVTIIIMFILTCSLISGCTKGSAIYLYNNSNQGIEVKWDSGRKNGNFMLASHETTKIAPLKPSFEINITIRSLGNEYQYSFNSQDSTYWHFGGWMEGHVYRIQFNGNGLLVLLKNEEDFPVSIPVNTKRLDSIEPYIKN